MWTCIIIVYRSIARFNFDGIGNMYCVCVHMLLISFDDVLLHGILCPPSPLSHLSCAYKNRRIRILHVRLKIRH